MKLHVLHSSLNTTRVTKSRRMRWAVHGARMGEKRDEYRDLVRKPEIRDYLEDLGVDGLIIIK